MTQQHLSLNLTGANGFAEQQSGIDEAQQHLLLEIDSVRIAARR